MTNQNLFHVGIPEPENLRKQLLEATRATISCLQRYEKFKNVREDKQAAIQEFSVIVKEIYTLDDKLSRILPKVGQCKKEKPTKDFESKKKSTLKKRKVIKTRDTELKSLENDLAKIDDALDKLK